MANLDAPTPGQSLTSDKGNPMPWEKPPEFSTVEDAMAGIFKMFTEEGKHAQLLEFLRKGTAIETLVKITLGEGFFKGKWTTDLQLLLIEPTTYLLMWLAEQADIEPTLEIEGDEDFYAEEKLLDKAANTMAELTAAPKPSMEDLESQVPSSLLSNMSSFKNKE